MAFPFFSFLRRRKAQNQTSSLAPGDLQRRPFSKRRLFYILLYIIALVFLILVLIGNVGDKPVLRETYFLKIDLSEIIPRSVPDAVLINSIARTIGLHDFYQVGLWNFCEGYEDGSGITYCSEPKKMYFFNPVEILLSELLAGATIALPGDVTKALNIARIASHWMFGLFITATVLTFICIFLAPLSISTSPLNPSFSPVATQRAHSAKKRYLFPLTLLTFVTFLLTAAASIIATVMFTIFKIVFVKNEADLNIHAQLGTRMLVFMWIAVGMTAIGYIFHAASLCACCCRGLRKRRHGERRAGLQEEKGMFGRRENSSSSRGLGNEADEKRGDTRRRFHSWRRMRVDG
ncbi:conserved hypothetical protein [Uncinocarpus reesii 1704]|uniref:Integral membrane protein n=1 Tax=Uncinocarpus reesii (strain UAMH 1704) TaxID=336963 RepID=C4JTJ9_UNCRE|nr:uncharacterized protein UREG_05788 [Uncinocarpus reesii 1704]EEP80946.1 conserved hypothetical protein [Uncinocarpus reesii 1704]